MRFRSTRCVASVASRTWRTSARSRTSRASALPCSRSRSGSCPGPAPRFAWSQRCRSTDEVTWHQIIGDGPPVVLLHGGTGDPASYWAPQIPVLSERFRLVLTQYPGYGDDAGGDAEFSIPGCAAHV